jgi:quercetin dioxygenase-like cupin family protein
MAKWKPGNSSQPHFHSKNRQILVLSGATNCDPEHATGAIKPGTYVTHFARQVHYDSARKDDEPAVELVWGEGPVATVVCATARMPRKARPQRRCT